MMFVEKHLIPPLRWWCLLDNMFVMWLGFLFVSLCPWRLSFQSAVHQALCRVFEIWLPSTSWCSGSEISMERPGNPRDPGSYGGHSGWSHKNHHYVEHYFFLQRIRAEWYRFGTCHFEADFAEFRFNPVLIQSFQPSWPSFSLLLETLRILLFEVRK